MDKIWIIPICFAIIGYFGIFWALSLSNMEVNINLNMDDNTLEAVKSINYSSLEKVGKEDFCYVPRDCFRSTESFLAQFPNKTIPTPTVCYHLVYCGWIKDANEQQEVKDETK